MAASQVGMYHVTLDRPGPDDSDLDHQVVEAFRPEPWQHGLLGAAFDLEYADRIGGAAHIVHGRVVLRDVGESKVKSVMLFGQVEGFSHAGKHAQSQYID